MFEKEFPRSNKDVKSEKNIFFTGTERPAEKNRL